MTWVDSSVRGVDRRGVKCREEVWTGNSLLIKHYSTVINILPVEIRPQTRWVQARKHHRLFHRTHPLLPLHSAALTWIITLSGFPQTLNAPQHPSDWVISHTLSPCYLDLEKIETPLRCERLFSDGENWCNPKMLKSKSSLCCSTATRWILYLGSYTKFPPTGLAKGQRWPTYYNYYSF